jgi:aminopeptidase 2
MPAVSEVVVSDAKADDNPDLANLLSSLKDEAGKWKITQFKTTPPMSSYIVAYANGHFEYLERSVVMPLSGKTLPLRVYGSLLCSCHCFITLIFIHLATADNIHQAQFALDVKADVLPWYEKVFDVEFPLPKLDTLVVCMDFFIDNRVVTFSPGKRF